MDDWFVFLTIKFKDIKYNLLLIIRFSLLDYKINDPIIDLDYRS
jgi:hypothetical protein